MSAEQEAGREQGDAPYSRELIVSRTYESRGKEVKRHEVSMFVFSSPVVS